MEKIPITKSRSGGMPIGALSRLTGVHIETIRYYEKVGVLPAPQRTAGGRRVYRSSETRMLTFVRRARELGFTLDEIRTLIDLGGPRDASCADVRALGARHLAAVRARISDLQKLERSLAVLVSQCSGDPVADCALLDALYPRSADNS